MGHLRGSQKRWECRNPSAAWNRERRPDLFVVDLLRPHLVPSLRVVSAFVHNGQPGDIISVMVDGDWVMRDGKVLTIDEDDVVRRAEAVGHAVWRRLLERYPNVPFPRCDPSADRLNAAAGERFRGSAYLVGSGPTKAVREGECQPAALRTM